MWQNEGDFIAFIMSCFCVLIMFAVAAGAIYGFIRFAMWIGEVL